jgi:hypothetical protein
MSSDNVTITSGLNGIVPPNTQTSMDRMGYFLGLGTATAVKEWMQSAAFKPHFDELYNSWLKPQQERVNSQNKVKKQGPQLQIVQAALIDGERHGDESIVVTTLTSRIGPRLTTTLYVSIDCEKPTPTIGMGFSETLP